MNAEKQTFSAVLAGIRSANRNFYIGYSVAMAHAVKMWREHEEREVTHKTLFIKDISPGRFKEAAKLNRKRSKRPWDHKVGKRNESRQNRNYYF